MSETPPPEETDELTAENPEPEGEADSMKDDEEEEEDDGSQT